MAIEIDKLKREFLEYLEIEKGSSLKTVENYDRYLTRFFKFGKIIKPRDITDENVREFRLFLNRQSGIKIKGQVGTSMKKNTQNYYLIALRVFLKYLMILMFSSPYYNDEQDHHAFLANDSIYKQRYIYHSLA